MITTYNRNQKLLATINLIAGLCLLIVAAGFFYLAFGFILKSFGITHDETLVIGLAAGAMLIIFISGFLNHRSGVGTYGYHESDLFLQSVSSGGGIAEHYAGRVSAPAYLLTQVFLSASLQWLKARDRLRSLLKDDPELEQRLKLLLEDIDSTSKWHPIKQKLSGSIGSAHLPGANGRYSIQPS